VALIACPECKSNVSDQAVGCPQCGYPIRSLAAAPKIGPAEVPRRLHPDYVRPDKDPIVQGRTSPHIVKSAKSRGIYIILGLFLGGLGIHNFYAGYYGRGLAQLLVVLILGWFVIGFVIVGVWVIIELFTVTQDAAGDQMV
jgi:TM2 domain-containing membrane protein YozV